MTLEIIKELIDNLNRYDKYAIKAKSDPSSTPIDIDQLEDMLDRNFRQRNRLIEYALNTHNVQYNVTTGEFESKN